MRYAIVSTLLIVALFSCSAVAQTPQGTWEWSHSVLRTGEVIDPVTEGYTRTLHFTGPPDREFFEIRGYEVHIAGLWIVYDFWWEGAVRDYLEVDYGNSVPYLEGILTFGPGADTMVVDNYTDQHFVRAGTVPREDLSWGEIRSLFR